MLLSLQNMAVPRIYRQKGRPLGLELRDDKTPEVSPYGSKYMAVEAPLKGVFIFLTWYRIHGLWYMPRMAVSISLVVLYKGVWGTFKKGLGLM